MGARRRGRGQLRGFGNQRLEVRGGMATMITARIAMTVWIAGSGIGKGVVMSGYSGFQRGGGQIEAQTQMANED